MTPHVRPGVPGMNQPADLTPPQLWGNAMPTLRRNQKQPAQVPAAEGQPATGSQPASTPVAEPQAAAGGNSDEVELPPAPPKPLVYQARRPPDGIGDGLLWDVSYALEQEHKGRFNGVGRLWCCNQEYPCQAARLAARGLLTAWERGMPGEKQTKADGIEATS
jgi:hypothetical protein